MQKINPLKYLKLFRKLLNSWIHPWKFLLYEICYIYMVLNYVHLCLVNLHSYIRTYHCFSWNSARSINLWSAIHLSLTNFELWWINYMRISIKRFTHTYMFAIHILYVHIHTLIICVTSTSDWSIRMYE